MNAIDPAAQIFKLDISRVFCHIRINPGDIDLLSLQHQGKFYLIYLCHFGYRLGSFSLSNSATLRYFMKNNDDNALLNYIDDLVYCGVPSTIQKSYEFSLELLQQLGLDISRKNYIHLLLRPFA